jgi:AraC-like DNA-binding protein
MKDTVVFVLRGVSFEVSPPEGRADAALIRAASESTPSWAIDLEKGSAALDDEAIAKLQAIKGAWRLVGHIATTRLVGLLERVIAERASRRPAAAAMAAALMVEFLVTALRALDSLEARGEIPWSIEAAVRYATEHYELAHRLDFYTKKCATNESDFSRRFKETTGYPLFEYLNRKRIERACELLKSTRLTIVEISTVVGYNNLSFFNRYFRRIVGSSPREFRASSRGL